MNITEPIRRLARLTPGAVAVIRADDSVIRFAELDAAIDRVSGRLARLGLRAGQCVGLAITGPDESRGIVVALALARLGVASADPSLPGARMALFLTEGGRAAPEGVRSMAVEALLAGADGDGPAAPEARDDGLICRIIGSSGTTGLPKFVAVSHRLMAARVQNYFMSMGRLGAAHISAFGLGSSGGYTNMLRALWSGAALVLTHPAAAAAAIRRHRVESMVIAPVSLQQVVAAIPDGDGPLPSLRFVEVGGSALSPALLALARARLCPNIVAFIGATEMGGVASAPFDAVGDDPQAVGVLHAGVRVEAVDEAGRPLPAGSAGVLRIRSPFAVEAYLDDPVVSGAVFRDGWFYSGDMGAVSADGVMTVSGRVGEFINSGGIKIAPRVVEEVLLSVPDVTDAAAFGVPDRMGVVRVWAAIVASRPVPAAVLNAACSRHLGAARSPAFVLQMPALPRNANGKIMRDELVRLAERQQP